MEILNQFGINPILLAAQVVNFLILLFILKKFLYGPILKVLDSRKKTIEQSLKNAEEIQLRLERTNEEVEKILANALKEGQKIIDESKEMGVSVIEESKKTAAEILERANAASLEVIKSQRVVLEREMKEHLGGVVALALEKVTGEKFTTKERRILIEKEIKNLS